MSKISNTIMLLKILSNGKKYSINELSKILEVTPRMVRIYKEELEKAGIYIDTIMGPYGGYVLNQSISIPNQKFKQNDYNILNEYIEKEKDEIKKDKLNNLKNKIKNICINDINDSKNIKLIDDNLNKYNVLMRAMKENKKVKILYYSYDSGDNERIIIPRDIFLFKDGWYCSAYCELRNDFRHFEFKRIKKCEIINI